MYKDVQRSMNNQCVWQLSTTGWAEVIHGGNYFILIQTCFIKWPMVAAHK
ncbi:MAG: hypothetical protein RL160_1230 [Bacteroidota bacterium]|jgi:hypothetical protein